jgi:hypothetical protein
MTLSKMLLAKHWGWLWYVFTVAVSGTRSIICFLLTVFWIVCGFIGAEYFGKMWGVGGYIFGFLIGFVIPSTFTWLIELRDELLFRPLPACRRGKCQGMKDYVFQTGYEIYRCSCGDKYIFKTKEKQFVEILSDGTERPYKKLVGFRKWADDTK